jgi:hypothetical protein
MIVEKSKSPKSFLEIDLTGPEGNVFNLIAMGRKMSGSLGMDKDQFTKEMMSGDYENAVNTFEKYFGDYVILYK